MLTPLLLRNGELSGRLWLSLLLSLCLHLALLWPVAQSRLLSRAPPVLAPIQATLTVPALARHEEAKETEPAEPAEVAAESEARPALPPPPAPAAQPVPPASSSVPPVSPALPVPLVPSVPERPTAAPARALPPPSPNTIRPPSGRSGGAAASVRTQQDFYPRAAIERGLEGDVVVRLIVAADGAILEASVASSSGHPLLDAAALAAVRHIGRLPARQRQVLLPVHFRLDG